METWGKFDRLAPAGVNFFCWPCTDMPSKLSLRLQEMVVNCETKTLDNVFVHVGVSVQFIVIRDKAYEANYSLTNVRAQIESYVFDVIRSTVPRMDLDSAFESKDDISNEVKSQLAAAMEEYGYSIQQVLVTDVNPAEKVRHAMNEINANKRLKEAALEKAEAEKILVVKRAEASAESQFLSGEGVARQRSAIVSGLKNSIAEFAGDVGVSAKEVMNLLLVTQYFDMLDAIGLKSRQSSVFLKHSPAAVSDLQQQLRSGLSHMSK